VANIHQAEFYLTKKHKIFL